MIQNACAHKHARTRPINTHDFIIGVSLSMGTSPAIERTVLVKFQNKSRKTNTHAEAGIQTPAGKSHHKIIISELRLSSQFL